MSEESREPTNVLRDAQGRILYEGDKPPDYSEPQGRVTGASRSPWRSAGAQSFDDEPVDPAIEDDYRAAFGDFLRWDVPPR